jgi:predicted tellurium resistance membrane protein TerC
MGLTTPIFEIGAEQISGRDLILIIGGLFLLYKSVKNEMISSDIY